MTKYENDNDEELMLLYQRGDMNAFDLLYKRYAGKLYGYLGKKVSPSVRDELFQEIFLQIHQKRDLYRPPTPLSAWIFTLAKHRIADFYRSQNALKRTLPPSASREELSLDASEELLDLSSLSEKERQLLEKRYLLDWSFEQIASDLGIGQAGARKAISRALKFLRKIYE